MFALKKHLGKSVVITGSARGLGRSMAERFAGRGSQRGNHRYHDRQRQTDSERNCPYRPGVETLAVRLQCDRQGERKNPDGRRRATLSAEIDILVNNAGVTRDASFMKLSEEYWDMVLDTDLKGVSHLFPGGGEIYA